MSRNLSVRTTLILFLAAVTVGTSACSNRAVYDNLRLYQRQECRHQPISSYEQCLERARQSFEAYQHERREALGP